jgi:hypothetical protein
MVHAIVYPGTNESCPHLIAIEKWGKNTLKLGYPMFKFSGQTNTGIIPTADSLIAGAEFGKGTRIAIAHGSDYKS